MLQHVPHWLGHLLQGVRAGSDKLVIAGAGLAGDGPHLALTSPAFADGGRLPTRFTGDGEGVSPPLGWGEPPVGTAGFCLVVEDPDAPTPSPLVHAVVWAIPADARRLAEGAIAPDGQAARGQDVGRNSFRGEGWLPPDPPTGHGNHSYAFQLFALSSLPDLAGDPGRGQVVEAMNGRVLASGLLVGTYSRGEERPIGPGVLAPA
jgi:hypothetical protein